MHERFDFVGVSRTKPPGRVPVVRRWRIISAFILVWTLFVGVAIWWLLRGNAAPSVFILHESYSLQPALTERFHAWYRAEIGFQRIYPWLLFGPYVALLVACFPIERGRLLWSLPLNLAACAGFVSAAHALNFRLGMTPATVTIVRSGSISGGREMSRIRIWTGTNQPPAPFPEEFGKQGHLGFAAHGIITGATVVVRRDASQGGPPDLFAQMPPGFKPPLPPPGLARLGLWPSLLDLLAYGAIAGLAHSIHFYRRFREREHQALVLESSLANARLNTLRAQLQPHFLFNSLNAVAALLRRNPPLAEATLMSLSELLRIALSQSEKQEVTLREELEFVQRYLEIQETRFGDRLCVERDIDPATLDCIVPTLLLQPLVENAIRHGLEPAENGGLVRLTAQRRGERLALVVEDNGVGLAVPAPLPQQGSARPQADTVPNVATAKTGSTSCDPSRCGTGIGLGNLRARLEMLYGREHVLELVPRAQGGARVRVELPWRTFVSPQPAGV
jgi:hypothetical protein